MSEYAGYWISPEGVAQEVIEHFSEVKKNPKKYGLTKKDVQGTTEKDRERVLTQVMQVGFIRVRGHKTYTTFEMWRFNEWALQLIRMFLEKMHFWDADTITVSDLESKKYFDIRVGELKSDRALGLVANPKRRGKALKTKSPAVLKEDLRFEDLYHLRRRK